MTDLTHLPVSAGTIFDDSTLPWTSSLSVLTPVQEGASGRLYKREDWFAPLGYGGINGSKLRQLLVLADARRDAPGLLTGASVRSPQVSMAALVAQHFGQECCVVLGATDDRAARRNPQVAIAAAAGAEFRFVRVAYNPALQRSVTAIATRAEFAGWWRLNYGITTDHDASPEQVLEFHLPGAAQVANLPTVDTLYVTAGSCNTLTSILLGFALHRPSIRRIVTVGVGPSRLPWAFERLGRLKEATGGVADPALFSWRQVFPAPTIEFNRGARYVMEHADLHAARVVAYAQRWPATVDGIELHPTYEGKLATWLDGPGVRLFPAWSRDPSTGLLWIVGSEPGWMDGR